MPLLVRALLAFLTFPGVIASLIPFLIAQTDVSRGEGILVGWILVGIGLALGSWCALDFYRVGRGDMLPWPTFTTRRLVSNGLYRWVRNPMYAALLVMVLGWALVFSSPVVGLYWIALAITQHLRVVQYEEPALLRQFGSEWSAYAARTPRWFPRLRRQKNTKPSA